MKQPPAPDMPAPDMTAPDPTLPDAAAADAETWRVAPGDDLRWFDGAEEAVLFHSGSGETHLLDGDAAEILQSLEARPGNAADLVARLVPAALAPERAALCGRIEQCLREFRRLGLIEPVPR